VKKLKATNPELILLIRDLKKQSQKTKSEIWKSENRMICREKIKELEQEIAELERIIRNKEEQISLFNKDEPSVLVYTEEKSKWRLGDFWRKAFMRPFQ